MEDKNFLTCMTARYLGRWSMNQGCCRISGMVMRFNGSTSSMRGIRSRAPEKRVQACEEETKERRRTFPADEDGLTRTWREVAGQVVDPPFDLFEEVGDVLVVKGEAATQERVQDHSARPDVHLGACVQLARDDLSGG